MRSLMSAALVVVAGAIASIPAADAGPHHRRHVASKQVGPAPSGLQTSKGFWMSTFGPCEDLNVVTVMWCDRKALNGRR